MRFYFGKNALSILAFSGMCRQFVWQQTELCVFHAQLRLRIFYYVEGKMPNEKAPTGYPSVDKPWLKYYSEEAINAPLPESTIYEYLYENNKDYPADIAIHYYGRKITYKELFDNIDRTAKGFTALGVKQGDIVTIALPSVPEALYAVYALNKIGAVANMIHPLAGEKEILHYLNEVESRVAVIFDGTYEIIGRSIEETRVERAVVVSAADSLPLGIKLLYGLKHKSAKLPAPSPFLTWRQFLRAGEDAALPQVRKNPDEMAVISHTGGTTGEPKGVMCSDQNINALIWQIGCNLPHMRQEIYLVVLPPFINYYSLVNAMMEPLAFGFQVVLIPSYKPEKFGEYIRKYRPNHISSIPSFWETILSLDESQLLDLSCLNHIYYGGETMSIEKETAINDLLLSRGAQNTLCKGLGSTEMISAATVSYDGCNLLGSVGIPLVKLNCKIVEPDTTRELSYGQEGEICFTGPTLMQGYYHKSEATDEIIKLHADGMKWLHTGDVGYINEDGVVFVTGRIKRIIMTKGADQQVTKLFPDRIEKALYAHPAVALCCVIDERRIHYPKAYVVLKYGVEPSDRLTREIRDACRDTLPSYMIPEEIEYRSDLPRTERGKVDYRALEKESRY